MKHLLSQAVRRLVSPAWKVNRAGMNFNEHAHNRTSERGAGYERAGDFTRRYEPGARQEDFGDYQTATPQQLLLDRLRDKRPQGGAQSEVNEMLEMVLKAGGSEIVQRMKELDAEIAAEVCSQPEVGEVIEAFYVPLLQSALALSDEEFDAEYPGEGRVDAAQRAELADAIDAHAYDCPRCMLKASSDWEWYHHVEGVPSADAEKHRFQVKA
ncbi:MAG TPA: hypothetical protein VF297_12590 [Pyrinomonadaceae bacterium]